MRRSPLELVYSNACTVVQAAVTYCLSPDTYLRQGWSTYHLETACSSLQTAFLMGKLDCEGFVRIHIGQCKKICTANEKMPVKTAHF